MPNPMGVFIIVVVLQAIPIDYRTQTRTCPMPITIKSNWKYIVVGCMRHGRNYKWIWMPSIRAGIYRKKLKVGVQHVSLSQCSNTLIASYDNGGCVCVCVRVQHNVCSAYHSPFNTMHSYNNALGQVPMVLECLLMKFWLHETEKRTNKFCSFPKWFIFSRIDNICNCLQCQKRSYTTHVIGQIFKSYQRSTALLSCVYWPACWIYHIIISFTRYTYFPK